MPVRNLIYDALSYGAQVYEEEKALKQSKKKIDSAEYLSGFGKDSKIYPVITLVINWGNKKWDGPRKLSDMLAALDKESVNVINTFTDAGIQIKVDEEGKVKMSRATEVLIERGMEKGKKEGENKHLIEQICKKLAKGKSVEVIADEVEESADRVQEICNVIGEISTDYDVDKIYEAMSK